MKLRSRPAVRVRRADGRARHERFAEKGGGARRLLAEHYCFFVDSSDLTSRFSFRCMALLRDDDTDCAFLRRHDLLSCNCRPGCNLGSNHALGRPFLRSRLNRHRLCNSIRQYSRRYLFLFKKADVVTARNLFRSGTPCWPPTWRRCLGLDRALVPGNTRPFSRPILTGDVAIADPKRAPRSLQITTKRREGRASPLGPPFVFSRATLFRVGHLAGNDKFVELFGGDVTELERGLFEGCAVVVRLFRDLGGLVVTDLRRKRGNRH